LVTVLPDAVIPGFTANGDSWAVSVGDSIGRIDNYVPIIGPLQFVLLMLGAFAALLAFRLGVFVFRLVRG
jgi:hypothetical protein